MRCVDKLYKEDKRVGREEKYYQMQMFNRALNGGLLHASRSYFPYDFYLHQT